MSDMSKGICAHVSNPQYPWSWCQNHESPQLQRWAPTSNNTATDTLAHTVHHTMLTWIRLCGFSQSAVGNETSFAT